MKASLLVLLFVLAGATAASPSADNAGKGVSDQDLWITLSNGGESVLGGTTTEYRVQVGNFGPGSGANSHVAANFGAGFTVMDWICEASGIASCAANGSGNISETVNLPVGDSVLFTIMVSVPVAPEDVLLMDASVTGNLGTSDPVTANNTVQLAQRVGIFTSTFEDLPLDGRSEPTDLDGDGWWQAIGDCCESADECPNPAIVNPGAAEIPNNGVDDDCDATTLDDTPARCSANAKFGNVAASDLALAMDLCQFATESDALPDRTWGLVSADFLDAAGTTPSAAGLIDIEGLQTAVMTNYGTGGIVPQQGATMAGLSTGTMRDANDPGYVNPNSGTDFRRFGQPPAAYLAANGGVLPASTSCNGACPAGSGGNDSVNLRLRIRVPTNAQGFSYEHFFLTSEYWTYACTNFNDFSLALLESGSLGLPADGNIAFDTQNNPLSVNNGFFNICQPNGCYTCPGGSGPLAGTGMELGNTGGGTGWLQTTAPVVPGEVMELELMIFDVSDGILDSNLLLDNFRWLFDPTGVGTGPPRR